MATTKSKKALYHLVCQASSDISEEVLKQELERNLEDLKNGVLCYAEPTAESLAAFTSNKKVANKLTQFILELSKLIKVEESASKNILQTYLAGDFRGTKDSLKKLVADERCQKPLLIDIWHFFQAEKLYNLHVVKAILTGISQRPIFADVFAQLQQGLKSSLMAQLKAVMESPVPEKDKYFNQDMIDAWIHFNLRQQSELLQILLLYFHAKNDDENDILELLKLFTNHKFATKKLNDKVDKSLQDSIGHLESILIVYLLDLPALTEDNLEDVDSWKSPALIKDLDKNIGSNLGNLRPHGPPMLAWMLAHYVINPSDMNKFKHLGQTAFDLKVIEYLSYGLDNDALNANHVISAIAHGVIYSLLSILLTAFDPSRMANVFDLVLQVIKKDVISNVIWKEGLDQASGVSGYIGTILNETPVDDKNAIKLLNSLTKSGSKTSADNVFDYLANKDIFAEPVEDVPSHFIDVQGQNFVNLVARHKGVLVLNNGLQGILSSDNKYYQWKFSYNGFKILFNTIDTLLGQVVRGAKNVSQETLDKVINILDLMEALSRKTLKMGKHQQMMKNLCLSLIDKFTHVPQPPTRLLAGCLRCLSTCLDDQVWKCLTESGLFPHMNNRTDLNPGIIGTLLAQQECVLGQYPMTSAWLEMLTQRYHHPSSLFVVEEILPSYQNWRFVQATDKWVLGQKVLQVCSSCHDKIINSLLKPLPNQTLINIASIGDRMIQSCYEAQNTSEHGLGVEMAKLVMLALELLNSLLTNAGSTCGQLGKVIGSSEDPHFLLIVAHYIYHLQTPGLALSSIRFLSTVSTLFPMSLLACLGNDAEALRDILIHRLESQTEDIQLKIAILKFFTASVKCQPGLMQLLLNDQDGCLKSVMTLLETSEAKTSASLHLQLVEFIYNLWSHSCVLAMSHLKKQDKFWDALTWPLFNDSESKLSIKVNGFILRIISTEIFAFKANIDKSLHKILEKLFDDKASSIGNWCNLMVDNASKCQVQDTSILSVDVDSSPDIGIFLMSSWKTLLIVLSKDQPINLSPTVCHKITNSLIKAIRRQLVSMQDINMRMITSLSETSLILMQRWLTKCAGESMIEFMSTITSMMDEFVACYETLAPRVRIAILAIASTALKLSAFKMENEAEKLTLCLPSACSQVEKALLGQDDPKEAVLALGLLRGLLQRLPDVKYWFDILHQKSILMSILSHCHHNLRACQHPEVIQASFGLLLTLSKSQQGTHALLTTDLSQMIWLPLSSINKKLDQEWILVFTLALQLALNLIQVGQQHALEHVLTVVALLQDQLTAFLIGPKNGNLEKTKMDLTTAAASLIGHLMVFYKQWQMIHPSSLSTFYRGMTSLLHTSACLLIRPSLLHMVVNQKSNVASDKSEQELQRVRRLSSTEHDSETSTCPDTVHVQNRLLCTISSCFGMLIALSPDLVALVTDDILDTDAYEQLLNIGFSTPAFEQDEVQAISYGTVISICNFCIRTMTHGDRSPSPAAGAASKSAEHLMDRKKLLMVLEQGLTLMLSQALLCLSNDNLSSRDKQLLRRELGAELGSVNETMRRFFYRSSTKSPQTVLASPTSSTSSVSGGASVASRLNKSDEQFMKFVSNIVQKVFK